MKVEAIFPNAQPGVSNCGDSDDFHAHPGVPVLCESLDSENRTAYFGRTPEIIDCPGWHHSNYIQPEK